MEPLEMERDRTEQFKIDVQTWNEWTIGVFNREAHLCHIALSNCLPSRYMQINIKVWNKNDTL